MLHTVQALRQHQAMMPHSHMSPVYLDSMKQGSGGKGDQVSWVRTWTGPGLDPAWRTLQTVRPQWRAPARHGVPLAVGRTSDCGMRAQPVWLDWPAPAQVLHSRPCTQGLSGAKSFFPR